MPGHHRVCHTPSLGPRLQGQSHQHPQTQGNGPTAGVVGGAGGPSPSQTDIGSQNCGEGTSVLGAQKSPSGWAKPPTPFLPWPGLANPWLTMGQGLRTAHVDHRVLLRTAGRSWGPGRLAVEGWGSRSAGCLSLFRGATGCGRKTAVSRARRQEPRQQVETPTHH